MPEDFKNCDPNELLIAARCFLTPVTSQAQREAIKLYLNSQALLALAGPDLTDPATLQIAASGYNRMSAEELSAISLYLSLQSAIEEDAVLPDITIEGLKTASRCFLCMPRQRRQQALMLLRCQLSTITWPD